MKVIQVMNSRLKFVFNSRTFKIWASQNVSYFLILQRLNNFKCSTFQFKKYFSGSPSKVEEGEIPSTLRKYELFSEETAPVILDVEEERQKIIASEKVHDEFEGICLKRSIHGVFDIEEVVDLLKKEKGENIVVVKIPPEYKYADYMVIVNGRSTKHMSAMSDFIRRLYKKKVDGKGLIPKLEGKTCNTWMALDLGNIVLHVFSKAGRPMYDLETLWSVGKDYDTLTWKKDTLADKILTDYAKILASLSPNT